MQNINDFRSKFKFGGARTSLFKVKITNPINGSADNILPFMCHAASSPESTLQNIDVMYFGRAIKVPGNRIFQSWDVTIYNDEDFLIKNAMENWSNFINSYEGNTRRLPTSEVSLYKSTAEVTHISQTGNDLRTYKIIGMYPESVSGINLDWSQEGITNFSVRFQYDYFYVEGNTTGNAGGK